MSYDEDFDPFAPPENLDESGRKQTHEIGYANDFTVSDVLRRSWQIYRSQMGSIMGTCVFYLLLTIVPTFLVLSLQKNNQAAKSGLSIFFLLNSVLSIYLTCGLFGYLLEVTSGRKPNKWELFHGWQAVGNVLVGSILLSFFIIAPASILIGISFLFPPLLLLTIPVGVGIYFFMIARYSQFFLVLVERQAGVVESLNLSYRVMKGRVLQYLWLGCVLTVINYLGLLALIVGALITWPLSLLCIVVYYKAVTGQPIADPMALVFEHQDE